VPLLIVTGGPIAPSGETLSSASLTVRYFEPYADGLSVYPTAHEAELDSSSGGWKPLGSVDGTAFAVPGAGSGDPKPPRCVLVERQEYVGGGVVTFRYGPLRVLQTSLGEWHYGTAKEGVEFVADADLPAAGAVLTSSVGAPGGVASLDGSQKVVQRLSYEGSANGVPTLDGSQQVDQAVKVMRTGSAGSPGLAFAGDTDTGVWRPGANLLAVATGGAERARFGANGLSFNAGADWLGDYETGTWTPVYTAIITNPTYTASVARGQYVRVGRVVVVSAWLATNVSATGSGVLRLGGFPFPVFIGATNDFLSVPIGDSLNWVSNLHPVALRFRHNESHAQVLTRVSADARSAWGTINATNLITGVTFHNDIRFSFAYITA